MSAWRMMIGVAILLLIGLLLATLSISGERLRVSNINVLPDGHRVVMTLIQRLGWPLTCVSASADADSLSTDPRSVPADAEVIAWTWTVNWTLLTVDLMVWCVLIVGTALSVDYLAARSVVSHATFIGNVILIAGLLLFVHGKWPLRERDLDSVTNLLTAVCRYPQECAASAMCFFGVILILALIIASLGSLISGVIGRIRAPGVAETGANGAGDVGSLGTSYLRRYWGTCQVIVIILLTIYCGWRAYRFLPTFWAAQQVESWNGTVLYANHRHSDVDNVVEWSTPSCVERILGLTWPIQLDLSCCRSLDDDDLTVLRHFTNIEQLDLSGSPISDICLEEIRILRKLEVLSLGGTQVTVNGIRSLHGCSSLRQLSLRPIDCEEHSKDVFVWSDDNISSVRRMLPGVNIEQ